MTLGDNLIRQELIMPPASHNRDMLIEATRRSSWKFIAMTQGQAKQRAFDELYILISIQDSGETPVAFADSPMCAGLLAMQFDDIDRAERGKTLFSNADALDILDFVEGHKHAVKTIACHCKVGMSRSPAVIAALAELLGCGDDGLTDLRGKRKQRPNRHVYNTLIQQGRRHPICDT
jgi:predicted protein tyrosine phosphatase